MNRAQHLGLDGLNLEVRKGEVFGFLGPNGAGKTTTIQLPLDLLRPTRGCPCRVARRPGNLRGGVERSRFDRLAERLELDLSRPIRAAQGQQAEGRPGPGVYG